MTILNTISLESNKQIKINFDGGDLSSDGGLLLIKEFAARIGLLKLVKQLFKTNMRLMQTMPFTVPHVKIRSIMQWNMGNSIIRPVAGLIQEGLYSRSRNRMDK